MRSLGSPGAEDMETKPYMNQKEAAQYIGVSVNTFKEHVRDHLKQKEIGKQVFFIKDDIDNFMQLDLYCVSR